jgi:hypothetical protein
MGSRVETRRFQAMGQNWIQVVPPHHVLVRVAPAVRQAVRAEPRGQGRAGLHFSRYVIFCAGQNTVLLMTAGVVRVTNRVTPGSGSPSRACGKTHSLMTAGVVHATTLTPPGVGVQQPYRRSSASSSARSTRQSPETPACIAGSTA